MAGNPNKVVGRAKIRIDGASMPVAGDTSLDLGGVNREGVDGDFEVGAFRESSKPAHLEFSVLAKSSFSAAQFGRIDDATVHVDFDNGHSYMIRHAWAEGPPPMATSDGKAKCVMYGQPAEELS